MTQIKVYNDNKEVFSGSSLQFLKDNQYDEDIISLIDNAYLNGTAEQDFISGNWRIEKLIPVELLIDNVWENALLTQTEYNTIYNELNNTPIWYQYEIELLNGEKVDIGIIDDMNKKLQ
jgi:hypothetical protein